MARWFPGEAGRYRENFPGTWRAARVAALGLALCSSPRVRGIAHAGAQSRASTAAAAAGPSLLVRVHNGTEAPQSLIAFLSSPRVPAGAKVYCWQCSLLAAGAEWVLRVPLRFEAAGLIATETGVIVSNVEPALRGQRFRLFQAANEPLRIEAAGNTGSAASIEIRNDVQFARRTALLMLGQRPVLGFLLDAGDEVDFEPSTRLVVALRPQCDELEVMDPPTPSASCTFDLARSQSVARLEGRLTRDPITGAVSCAVTAVPRERSELMPEPR